MTYTKALYSPLLCWRVGEVTFRMQGVSCPSLSCEESLERSLERRRSRERSQPPLAPCKLMFLCSASTREALAWLLLFKRKPYVIFIPYFPQGQNISIKVATTACYFGSMNYYFVQWIHRLQLQVFSLLIIKIVMTCFKDHIKWNSILFYIYIYFHYTNFHLFRFG